MRVDHKFCVRHYAGKVVYSTEGIIEKNRDTLQQEGIDMLLSSESDFTVLLGEIEAKSTTVRVNDVCTEALGTRRFFPFLPSQSITWFYSHLFEQRGVAVMYIYLS